MRNLGCARTKGTSRTALWRPGNRGWPGAKLGGWVQWRRAVPIAQTLIREFDEEMAATRRALERVPSGKAAWKPHPKSMPLGRLATLLAELPSWALNAVTLDELDIAPPGGPPFRPVILGTGKEIVELLDRNVQAAGKALAATGDAGFAKQWTFKYAG